MVGEMLQGGKRSFLAMSTSLYLCEVPAVPGSFTGLVAAGATATLAGGESAEAAAGETATEAAEIATEEAAGDTAAEAAAVVERMLWVGF